VAAGAGLERVGVALVALPRGAIVRRKAVAPEPASRPYDAPHLLSGVRARQ
jgi:hypothetical protein